MNRETHDSEGSLVTWARRLRWAGVGAVGLSACVYLMQGITHIDVDARCWIYLAFMVVLATAGVVSRLSFKDPLGARILFALAAALIPVQAAQVAGMLHWYLTASPATDMPAAFVVDGIGALQLALTAAASLALALPVAYAAFSILAREHARSLTSLYLGLSTAMLVPWRASWPAFAVLAMFVLAALALERRMFAQAVVFRTLEGLAVRTMFVIPAAIVTARTAYHVDGAAGSAAFGGLLAAALVYGSRVWVPAGRWQSGLQFLGWLAGISAWLGYATQRFDTSAGYYAAILLAPLGAMALEVGRVSRDSRRTYGMLGSLLITLAAACLVALESSFAAQLCALACGVVLVIAGLNRLERAPVVGGIVSVTLGTAALVHAVFATIAVSAWIALALLGVAFVLGSSFLERHGRRLRDGAAQTWARMAP